MSKRPSGGGFPAIAYALRKSREAGGFLKMFRALRTRNACKTCALGMGGQKGGMVNEIGHFPEVCKKSIQAMAADMQGAVPPEFFSEFSLEELKAFSPRELESSGRLTQPVYAALDDTHYRPIGWDEALDRVAAKLRATDPEESFFYFSGRSSNEAGFLLQLFARRYGTNNVNNCSYYCHQASGVGLSSVTGSGTATVVLEDLDHCDLLFLIGANPASNHPRFMRTLLNLRRRGGKVIVINPVREAGLESFRVPSDMRSLIFGSQTCDLYVQPHAGGDAALLIGIAKAIIERGATDDEFIDNYTDGSREFISRIEKTEWGTITSSCGVPKAEIQETARLYAASQKTVFAWAMGITHHTNGVQNVQAIANLAMLRGMVGRPNCGLLPLRGHSNVQGIGSMGVVPKLKGAMLDRLESRFGVEMPKAAGLDTLGCLERATEGRMKFALCLGGNLYGSNPDAASAHRALTQIDQVVFLSTTLNTGHAWGRGKETIILPVLARDEESQRTTQESMFNFVRLSDGGPKRLEGPRSEVDVTVDLARRLFPGDAIDWESLREHETVRGAIGAVVSGYEAISDIGKTQEEFQIGGRTFHEPVFKTPNGRAKFHVVDVPSQTEGLRLLTLRSEGQFNTVVYEDHDYYRGQDRRDVVMMHPDEIVRLGLKVDQRATVKSEAGEMHNMLVREIDVRPGNVVMYFPEANALVPRRADPASRTPAFKNTPVTVFPTPNEKLLKRDQVASTSAKRKNLNAC